MRFPCALLAALITAAGAAAFTAQQRPVFRASIDLVTIDVAVRSGRVPVGGLTAEDFEVLDNGVRQRVEIADRAALPIDMTMVLDVSGSMRTLIGTMTEYADRVLALLSPDDRLRLLTVGTSVVQQFGFSSPTARIDLGVLDPFQWTSLYDGIAAALMRSRQPDRRHLIVVVSDGYDTTSSLGIADLKLLVRRTDGVLYAVVAEDPGTGSFPDLPLASNTRDRWAAAPYRGTPIGVADSLVVGDLARQTGGSYERVYATQGGLAPAVKNVLDQFRHSYVLRYTATGVDRQGWHDLVVRLPKHPEVEIRARRGYWGG
jgi:VWFA-related protein